MRPINWVASLMPLNLRSSAYCRRTLTNVHRHSGASAAHVAILEDAGQVVLEIKDNGRGIAENCLLIFTRRELDGRRACWYPRTGMELGEILGLNRAATAHWYGLHTR